MGEGEHDDAEEGGVGAVDDRSKHVLQGDHDSSLTVPNAGQEALKKRVKFVQN